jgi:hypothetical protein
VRLTFEQRSALRTLGNAAVGVALGLSVLGIAFVASQFATGEQIVVRATSSPSAAVNVPAAATVTPTPPAATPTPATTPAAATTPLSSPTTAPTAAAEPTPPPSPSQSATTDPMTATAYANGGRRYAALRAPIDYVYRAPVAGTVQVRLYQIIDGEVRVGSNVPALPFFPYVTVDSSDRRIIFRPGALNADTQLLIKDGERADLGTPLFKTVGDGASSWRTFYDRGVTANVIASVAALPSGAELDPVPIFTTR